MQNKNNTIIYIIDDSPEILRGLQWLFESVQLKVITFCSPLSFIEICTPDIKGCVITDLRMPDISGLELLQQIRLVNKDIPVILVSGHADVSMAVQAMKLGAVDVFLKPIHEQNLLETVQRVIRPCQRKLNDPIETELKQSHEHPQLTSRELQILSLIIKGKLNKQMASELGVSLSTIEMNRAQLMRKLKIKTLAELIQFALSMNFAT